MARWKQLSTTIVCCLSVTLAAALVTTGSGAAQTPEVGQKAPAFTLATPEGKAVRLSDLSGKGPLVLVVLRGYPGYDCPYCVKQVHDFEENAARFAQLHSEVLLVYPGPPAELDQHAMAFLAKQNPLASNVHLVLDPDYRVTNLYGLRWEGAHETAYPATFLIDQRGMVFFRKLSKVHADRTSAADVLAELEHGHGESR